MTPEPVSLDMRYILYAARLDARCGPAPVHPNHPHCPWYNTIVQGSIRHMLLDVRHNPKTVQMGGLYIWPSAIYKVWAWV